MERKTRLRKIRLHMSVWLKEMTEKENADEEIAAIGRKLGIELPKGKDYKEYVKIVYDFFKEKNNLAECDDETVGKHLERFEALRPKEFSEELYKRVKM